MAAHLFTKEQIFDEAQICYNNSKLLIQGMAELTKAFDEDFDIDNCFKQFDIIIQALLFSQALADRDFCKEEKELIVLLAGNNDLFECTDHEALNGLSWDKVYDMPLDEQVKLSSAINEILDSAAEEFVLPLALLDAATTQNSLKDLSSLLTSLSILLAAVDGTVEDVELITFQSQAEKLLLGKWADVKGLSELMMDEGEDSDSDEEV